MKMVLFFSPAYLNIAPQLLVMPDDAATALVAAGVAALPFDPPAAAGGSPVPTFTVEPSITGTPQVGKVLTGVDGTIINGAAVSRRWLLNGAAVSTAQIYVGTDVGDLVYEVTAEGPGGRAISNSISVGVVPAGSNPDKIGQIGFNMGVDAGQGTPCFTFLDRMKSSGDNGAWSNGAPISQYGYATGIGAGHTDTATYVGLERPLTGLKTYVMRNNGVGWNASLGLENGINIIDASNPNRIVFTVSPYNGLITANPLLIVTGATVWPDYKPNNPIETRDGIAIYLLEHEAAYLAGQIAHPAWLDKHKYTARLRPMSATLTNGSTVVNPADATPVGYMTYSEAAPSGIPIEICVALCNEAKADYHMTVPHAASDAWMEWAFAYVRDHLDPALNFCPEYSNEVWNPGFTAQYNYAAAHGNGDGYVGYGDLATRMIIKARQVFGAQASRIRGLFVRQMGNIYSFTQSEVGVKAVEGKNVRDYFEEVSAGFYLGGGAQDLAGTTSTAQQRADLMAEVARYEATGADFSTRTVTQNLVDQIRHGGVIPGWPAAGVLDCLDAHTANVQAIADFARSRGVANYSGYEGQNFHCNANGPLGATDATRVVNMMRAAANDPRISGTQPGSLMRDEYAMMRSKGMTMQTVFQDFYPNNMQYGCWGCMEGATSPDTNLWSFYRWYAINQPDAVEFEVNLIGGTAMTVGAGVTKVIASYGGLIPAQSVKLVSGTLPDGVSIDARGNITGTPTSAPGNYPVTFSATDGAGNTLRKDVIFALGAPPAVREFRYARVVVHNNAAGNSFIVQPRDLFFVQADGTVARPSWTGPRDDSDHTKVFPIPEIGDGDPSTFCQSPGIYEVGDLVYSGSFPAVGHYAQFGWVPTSVGAAPGVMSIYVSDDPIVPGTNAGTLVFQLNEADPSHWAADTPRIFAIA